MSACKSQAMKLDAALNLTGTKAARANVHLARCAVDYGGNTLDVGCPGAFGFPVGVTHQITGHDTLVANFAKLTHALHLLADHKAYGFNQTKVFYHAQTIFASKTYFFWYTTSPSIMV